MGLGNGSIKKREKAHELDSGKLPDELATGGGNVGAEGVAQGGVEPGLLSYAANALRFGFGMPRSSYPSKGLNWIMSTCAGMPRRWASNSRCTSSAIY